MECKLVLQKDNFPHAVTFVKRGEDTVSFKIKDVEIVIEISQLEKLAQFFKK
jgi:hypothetical protein